MDFRGAAMSETLSQTRREDLSSKEGSMLSQPALYVVLEGERPLSGGLRIPLHNVNEVRMGRGPARAFRVDDGRTGILEIPDPRMSSKHARLVREEPSSKGEAGGWILEDVGSTNGTFVSGKRSTQCLPDEPTVITLGATCLLFDPSEAAPEGSPSLVVDSTSLKSRPRGTATLVPAVEQTMPRLVRVAMSKLSVLLLGESGAGKEVLARTVHTLSGRSGPFLAINCGALAPALVESQLFGYMRGAFSGATRDEPGLIRTSSGGTLFLDEIGELPPTAQATLLRVLQEKEVLPVGGTKPVAVDLRVVAATLQPIDATALASHAYPLNVRELEHILSVALVTSSEDLLRLESVGEALKSTREPVSSVPESPRESRSPGRESSRASASPAPRPLSDEDLKLKEELTAALTRTRGNVSEISRAMGKTRMQIHRWMKRFGLDPESFRS